MLVIMHHGDVKCLFQAFLDIKTFRSLDIFQVNTSECRGDSFYSLAEFLRILFCNFNIKDIDTTINLKKKTLSFHNRLTAHRADVTQTEHGSTVRDNSYEVSFIGIFISCIGVLLNLKTRISNTRGVGETQICLCTVCLGWLNFDFSRASALMIFQGGFFRDFDHKCIICLDVFLKIRSQNYKKPSKIISFFLFFCIFAFENV